MSFDTFELFCEHMIDLHNELKENEAGENSHHNKHNCIFCDLNFHFFEELQFHYSKEHIYCQECNDLLTDEDALHKHNLREHGGLPKDIKEEPADGLTIKEEPIDCNDCGICDSCITIHGVAMSVDFE